MPQRETRFSRPATAAEWRDVIPPRPPFPGQLRRNLVRRDIEDLILRPGRPIGGHPELRERLTPGTTLQPVEATEAQLQELVARSLSVMGERVVWVDAGDEIVVDVTATRVVIRPGLVLIGLSLASDDHEPSIVSVPFAVGTPEDITGLHAVTMRVPEGPTDLVARWGNAVIAAAWGALVDVVEALAAAVGEDEAGDPLAAAALVCDGRTFGVVPQAVPTREQVLAPPPHQPDRPDRPGRKPPRGRPERPGRPPKPR